MDDSMASRLGSRRAELQRMRQATEDDLLAQQHEFLAQPKQLAAKVIRATRSTTAATNAGRPPPSTLKREQAAQRAAATRSTPTILRASALSSVEDDDDREEEEEDDEDDGYSAPRLVAPAVLSEIVERDSSSHTAVPPSAQHIPLGSVRTGFPSTFRVTAATAAMSADATNQPVKKSLFALQREQERMKQQVQADRPIQPKQTASGSALVQTGREQGEPAKQASWRDQAKSAEPADERQRISAENEQKLAGMSADEIEEAQRELQASLPPALIARLMHGRANNSIANTVRSLPSIDRLFGQQLTQTDEDAQPPVVEQEQPQASALMPTGGSVSSRSIPINPSPIPYPQSAKTEWMAPVPSPSAPPQWQQLTWHTGLTSSTAEAPSASAGEVSGSEAGTAWQYWRLDFRGCWIDERVQSSDVEDRYDGLYHHGLHAERAGYSLDEMLYLCHSQLPAQRQVMLELLTRVLTRVNDGQYVIPQPVSAARLLAVDFNALVMERLMVLGVVTVLRVAMDDAAVGIVATAVRGVEALLYRRDEEERRRRRRPAWRGHWLLPAELSQQALDAWDKPHQPAAVEDVEMREAEIEAEAGDRKVVEEDVRDNSEDETACRRDVVAGLVRMRLLPRLRFLLEVHSTPSDISALAASAETRVFSPLVHSILHILLLVSQHSASGTQAVASTPHLLPILSSLTLSLPQSSVADPHLLPLLSLLATSPTVVQQLASTGALLHCHSYMLVANGLPGSIAPQPSAAAFALSRNALYLWRTSLDTHALDAVVAAEEWTTFFPVMMQMLVRRHAAIAATATAEHKEEQKQAVKEKEAGWEREEMEQVRAAYNVLEALCGCIGADAAREDEDASSISVTHLVSSVDFAIAQFTSLLLSPLPATHQAEHVSCMAGMAHFVASYYQQLPTTAAFSASFSSHQLDRQWQTVWDKWDESPIVTHVLSQLCTPELAMQSSYSSAIFCFPSTSLSVPALSYVDSLLSLCRWLLASITLVADKRAAACERLRGSAVLRSLSRVSTSVCERPVVDAHTALLLYHIVMLYHHSSSDFSLSMYRAAMTSVCPLLTAGYRSEVAELLSEVLLGERSLSTMRVMREATWTRGRGGVAVCGVCDWSSRDTLLPSMLGQTLLPAMHASLGLRDKQQPREEKGLVQQSVSSPAAVSLYDGSSSWPLLLSRNLLILTSLSPLSTSHGRQTSTFRSCLHYLGLLIDCNFWSTANDRTVAVRSLMELLVRSPDCTTDPQLSLPLAHCSHSLLSGGEHGLLSFNTNWLNRVRGGWGSNFFMFANELVELYVSEAVAEEVWSELLLVLVRRELVRDYRLLVYSRCMEVEVAMRSGWPGWQHVLWPREGSAEVLAVYREYVSKRGGGGAIAGQDCVLYEIAMHHLLCDWFGEEAVRENREVADKEHKVRQRMGRVDESAVHSLLSYRYTRG